VIGLDSAVFYVPSNTV